MGFAPASGNASLIKFYLDEPLIPKLADVPLPVPVLGRAETNQDCPTGCVIESLGIEEFGFALRPLPVADFVLSYLSADERGDRCYDDRGRTGAHACRRGDDFLTEASRLRLLAAREDLAPVDEIAYRFVYFAADQAAIAPYVAQLRYLARADDPEFCNTLYTALRSTRVAVCGVFREARTKAGMFLLYCRLTKAPGITASLESCFPLALRRGDEWRLAYAAAFTLPPSVGGTDSLSFCGPEVRNQARFRSNLASGIGKPILGKSLVVSQHRRDSFYLAAEALNVPLGRLTGGKMRGWAYVKFWSNLDSGVFEINYEYLKSPRRMRSKFEAMQPTEAEAGLIQGGIYEILERAITASARIEGAIYGRCYWGG